MFRGSVFLLLSGAVPLLCGPLADDCFALQNLQAATTAARHERRSNSARTAPLLRQDDDDNHNNDNPTDSTNRFQNSPRRMTMRRDELFSRLVTTAATTAAFVVTSPHPALAAGGEDDDEAPPPPKVDSQEGGIAVYKTTSGLKYIELQPGNPNEPSPRYGQLCAIQYTGYVKLPSDADPKRFDSNSFLVKHGNGRIVPGLDEGIHTMKVGGKRRLIVPPKLGYVESGLGPIPELPWNRWSLNHLLEQMIAQRGGNLVFEVELKSVIDDEADQGYYEDKSPTPEEFERLKLGFQERSAAAAAAKEQAENNPL